MDAQRPGGDLRGHARVAVAIATDPRPRLQERPDARRPRPRPAGVGGRAVRPSGRRVERRIERPVQPRDDGEQRRVEEGHRGADLVERRRADQAQVRCPPQQRDLLAQAAAHLAILRRRQARIVEPGEEDGAAAERDERGPAPGLGRVRGEDGPDREAPDERVELLVGPAEAAQARDGMADRIVEDAIARGTFAPAQRPHPAARLGQVDQPEIEREGTDDRLGGVEIERAQLLVEPGALERVVVAAEGDRPLPDPFDQREQVRPGLLRDDLAEQGPEQPDLDRQRVARTRGPDPERLRGDRGRRRRTAQAGHGARPFRVRVATRSQPSGPQPFRRLVSCRP